MKSLKIAFKNLLKQRGYSFINVSGLAIGMACCLLILLYVQHELGYDRFHSEAENVYRVAWFSERPQTRTPHPMALALAQDFPEVITGVHKVLAASVASVTSMLCKDFVALVLVANLIAWPLAYFVMNTWLQDFAFRIHIGVWTFLLAGGLGLGIALLTVSYQALKAALMNPVDSLRYE